MKFILNNKKVCYDVDEIEGGIMGSRMDKYKDSQKLPMRSDKNKALYKQIYNAYDDFENLVVPSNAREITMSDLKKEITSRSEYRSKKDLLHLTDKNEEMIHKDKQDNPSSDSKNNQVYDINELLDKAVVDKKNSSFNSTQISNGEYLKKLKLDKRKTNIEQVKEMYEGIAEDESLEDESLLKTANLSLEILSDLKSDNEATMVSAPIKNEELPDEDDDFYSTEYKFSKRDFVGKDYHPDKKEEKVKESIPSEETEDEVIDEEENSGNGKFFLKVLFLIFGIFLIAGVLFFFIKYFNRV